MQQTAAPSDSSVLTTIAPTESDEYLRSSWSAPAPTHQRRVDSAIEAPKATPAIICLSKALLLCSCIAAMACLACFGVSSGQTGVAIMPTTEFLAACLMFARYADCRRQLAFHARHDRFLAGSWLLY